MKVKVDPELCIGCELCVQTCPEVFAMNSDKATAKVNPVPAQVEKTCQQAKDECPVEAIVLE
jgi:ferredoxin